MKKLLVSQDMNVCTCSFREEQAFLLVLPLISLEKKLYERGKRNVLTLGAASCYPFTSYEMCDDNGILLGVNKHNNSQLSPESFSAYRILAVDGADIMEKEAAPKEWHLRYCLDLFSLITSQVSISDGKTGESLANYSVKAHDLILGDRAYGTKTSMKHCKDHGGDFRFQMKNRAFNFYDLDGKQQNLSRD